MCPSLAKRALKQPRTKHTSRKRARRHPRRRIRKRTSGEASLASVTEPSVWAVVAGLHYVTDESPGIRRLRAGKHFLYRGPNGKPMRDRKVLARIKSLAIPPAWTDVWICPSAQ